MGYALWIDRSRGLAWAQGTHEYHPLGTAAISFTDRFRRRDFRQSRRRPTHLDHAFAGFFGSLEEVNASLAAARGRKPRATPAHLL